MFANVGYDREESLCPLVPGNHGWNFREGNQLATWPLATRGPGAFVNPLFTYPTPDPFGSIIGGVFLRVGGRRLYVAGDVSGLVFASCEDERGIWKPVAKRKLPDTIVRSFGTDARDRPYVLTGTGDPLGRGGRLYRIRIVR